jgi:hypothetical protein
MKAEPSDHPSTTETRGTPRRFLGRLGLVVAPVVAGLIAAAIPAKPALGGTQESRITVTILVYNYAEASPSTLAAAEREATRILDAAGASIAWVNCWDKARLSADTRELCDKGWTPQTPGLRLIPGSNRFLDAEFGVASIPVYATIYYDKVSRRAHNDDSTAELPILLGCVFAHEIGHLLLGDPRHVKSGSMQPQWGASQIQQAMTGRLLFTKAQARIIREQVITAANR